MLSRLFPYFSRFLCCTGYEIVTITVQLNGAGTPFTIAAPPGKFMLDPVPYGDWAPGSTFTQFRPFEDGTR